MSKIAFTISAIIAVALLCGAYAIKSCGSSVPAVTALAAPPQDDVPPVNDMFRAEHGAFACRVGCPFDFTLVANCEDGTKVYAPRGLYVRGAPGTGGYTHRKTDPEPIVVPLSYDWCAP